MLPRRVSPEPKIDATNVIVLMNESTKRCVQSVPPHAAGLSQRDNRYHLQKGGTRRLRRIDARSSPGHEDSPGPGSKAHKRRKGSEPTLIPLANSLARHAVPGEVFSRRLGEAGIGYGAY